GSAPTDERARYSLALAQVKACAEAGRLTITARRGPSGNPEPIARDFWQSACLQIRCDGVTLWHVVIGPCDGISEERAHQIKALNSADRTVKGSGVKALWPEQAQGLDLKTSELIRSRTERVSRPPATRRARTTTALQA